MQSEWRRDDNWPYLSRHAKKCSSVLTVEGRVLPPFNGASTESIARFSLRGDVFMQTSDEVSNGDRVRNKLVKEIVVDRRV